MKPSERINELSKVQYDKLRLIKGEAGETVDDLPLVENSLILVASQIQAIMDYLDENNPR